MQHMLFTNNKWHHSVFTACILLHSCRSGIKLCLQTDTKGEQTRPSKSKRQQWGGSEVLVQTAHWLSVTSWWDKVGWFTSDYWFSLALQVWCSMQIGSFKREWMKSSEGSEERVVREEECEGQHGWRQHVWKVCWCKILCHSVSLWRQVSYILLTGNYILVFTHTRAHTTWKYTVLSAALFFIQITAMVLLC